jgi:sterol-4alpha-carboxylate 3-dehydrogenase (decarboxylating)
MHGTSSCNILSLIPLIFTYFFLWNIILKKKKMSEPTPQNDSTDEEVLRVIITGGAGCIGFATIKALLKFHPNAIIHILDITTPSLEAYPFSIFAAPLHKDQIHFHKADITSPSSLSEVFESVKPNAVIHTASIIPSAARKRQLSNEGLWKINVEGTRNVLDISEQTQEVKVLVYTSSCDAVKPDSWMDFMNATEAETQHLKDRDAKEWDSEYARSKVCLFLLSFVVCFVYEDWGKGSGRIPRSIHRSED